MSRVLPIPSSPTTSTSRPAPQRAASARAADRARDRGPPTACEYPAPAAAPRPLPIVERRVLTQDRPCSRRSSARLNADSSTSVARALGRPQAPRPACRSDTARASAARAASRAEVLCDERPARPRVRRCRPASRSPSTASSTAAIRNSSRRRISRRANRRRPDRRAASRATARAPARAPKRRAPGRPAASTLRPSATSRSNRCESRNCGSSWSLAALLGARDETVDGGAAHLHTVLLAFRPTRSCTALAAPAGGLRAAELVDQPIVVLLCRRDAATATRAAPMLDAPERRPSGHHQELEHNLCGHPCPGGAEALAQRTAAAGPVDKPASPPCRRHRLPRCHRCRRTIAANTTQRPASTTERPPRTGGSHGPGDPDAAPGDHAALALQPAFSRSSRPHSSPSSV